MSHLPCRKGHSLGHFVRWQRNRDIFDLDAVPITINATHYLHIMD